MAASLAGIILLLISFAGCSVPDEQFTPHGAQSFLLNGTGSSTGRRRKSSLLCHQPFSGEDFGKVGAARERIEKHIRGEEDRIFAAPPRVFSDRDASWVLESFRREKGLDWDRYSDLPLPTTGIGEGRV